MGRAQATKSRGKEEGGMLGQPWKEGGKYKS